MSSDKPVSYGLEHVDTDRHVSFPLVRRAPVRPAPILKIGNLDSVLHCDRLAMHTNAPHYPRVLVKGDWT